MSSSRGNGRVAAPRHAGDVMGRAFADESPWGNTLFRQVPSVNPSAQPRDREVREEPSEVSCSQGTAALRSESRLKKARTLGGDCRPLG